MVTVQSFEDPAFDALIGNDKEVLFLCGNEDGETFRVVEAGQLRPELDDLNPQLLDMVFEEDVEIVSLEEARQLLEEALQEQEKAA
ncbi:MAG: hypothetical protein KDD62_05875 [Bdellovibrionales bacterium]|nr:hypothetical protein [Bdellovibrionales bacterium]